MNDQIRYIINKQTRYPTSWPYEGPACRAAGIPAGKVYKHGSEAIYDAKELTKYNPVGFVVIEIRANTLYGHPKMYFWHRLFYIGA